MVYTKDGYTASWVYQKAPTEFNFTSVKVVSKHEIYARAYISLISGMNFHQYWKYDGTQWYKLFDNQDTTGNIVHLPGDYGSMQDLAEYRCPVTDSMQLYLIGWDSFLLQSKS